MSVYQFRYAMVLIRGYENDKTSIVGEVDDVSFFVAAYYGHFIVILIQYGLLVPPLGSFLSALCSRIAGNQ
jgi:hypothetical protein